MLAVVADEADVGRWEAVTTWHSARAARVRAGRSDQHMDTETGKVEGCTLSLRRVLFHLAREFWHLAPVAVAQRVVQQSQIAHSLLRVGSAAVETHGAGVSVDVYLSIPVSVSGTTSQLQTTTLVWRPHPPFRLPANSTYISRKNKTNLR